MWARETIACVENLRVFVYDSRCTYKELIYGWNTTVVLLDDDDDDFGNDFDVLGAWVPYGLLLFIQYKDNDTEVSHCATPEKEAVISSPGLKQRKHARLWAERCRSRWRRCALAVTVLFLQELSCLMFFFPPLDDRGPTVSGSPPWWQEAGAAGSGRGHFASSGINYIAYPARLCWFTEIVLDLMMCVVNFFKEALILTFYSSYFSFISCQFDLVCLICQHWWTQVVPHARTNRNKSDADT